MERAAAALLVAILTALPHPPGGDAAWGPHGHELTGRAAALTLPAEMPAFFRRAADQLAYLNVEPDWWRDHEEAALDPALDAAYAPEHYVRFERLPRGALDAEDRYEYLAMISRAGLDARKAGLSPYRSLELFQRLRVGFRRWRAATNPAERRWLQEMIVFDAGVLGHYVADGANPHHTSIHTNGWVGPNPRGYLAANSDIHERFEGTYVRSHVTLGEVLPRIPRAPRTLPAPRADIVSYLRESHSQLERLFELERAEPFGERTTGREHEEFAIERLARGAEMLRDLWWTAWVTSGNEGDAGGRPAPRPPSRSVG